MRRDLRRGRYRPRRRGRPTPPGRRSNASCTWPSPSRSPSWPAWSPRCWRSPGSTWATATRSAGRSTRIRPSSTGWPTSPCGRGLPRRGHGGGPHRPGGSPDAPKVVSAAKAYIGEKATDVIQDCIQLHGGIGITWEHDLHLYLRRAMVDRFTYGPPDEHRERLATLAGLVTAGVGDSAIERERRGLPPPGPGWLAANLRRVTTAESPRAVQLRQRGVGPPQPGAHGRPARRRPDGHLLPGRIRRPGPDKDHLRAFTEEAQGYEMPMMFHLPTMTILAPTLLDFGTEEQKRHLPAVLRGEELWVQFLSEPSGGSDLAGAHPGDARRGFLRAVGVEDLELQRLPLRLRHGRGPDRLGRAQASRPVRPHHEGRPARRHRRAHPPGQRVPRVLPGVLRRRPHPGGHLVGEANDGWTVSTRLLYHEKLAVGGGHPLGVVLSGSFRESSDAGDVLAGLARQTGRGGDPAPANWSARGSLSVVQRA